MTHRIDARGMRCPWPAIRLARALRERETGEVEIRADDPAAPRELRLVADHAGWTFREGEEGGEPVFRLSR
ncbi:sulfurtransferase TusA family protein [Sphingomonas sp. HF-S3]|uniref:Sulfurtransferase TusA family protein n=1 Tax=Sphingomonas rustica TaxID=3103142 RepID=A0ABV0BDW9_9SPHN